MPRLRRGSAQWLTAVLLLTTAACSSGGDEKQLDFGKVKVCEVLTRSQLLDYGVNRVTQEAQNEGPDKSFSRCVWQSAPSSDIYLLAVSFDSTRDNTWIGEKNKTEPVSGHRASLTTGMLWVATGPETGVLGIEGTKVKKPIREIGEAVVQRLQN
ncbi:hypothetical protein [Kibdelosporangium phytohabitans]|uniref:DUF3558 domain-containing protein n=1 Tax=Kibdelosporangium phytohabitans TaxID=860235 RepID=A0A0N9IC39_9PSEU|nr:hypothetical protein [Kibdelosporangium phytohabitans]ALG12105.1 hypothetical protein AOZ06_39240 [Kibdelosporangium phytohabitans]MBE1463600.1 hypothetical protein [Kibdelosporangium phytohabitans]